MEKYLANEDPVFRTRALLLKEQRAELVKHHLWVLWTDYFKPPHFAKYPELHQLFNDATKQAGAAGGKGRVDPADGQKLLDQIAQISDIFWETRRAREFDHPHRRSGRFRRGGAGPVGVRGLRRIVAHGSGCLATFAGTHLNAPAGDRLQ